MTKKQVSKVENTTKPKDKGGKPKGSPKSGGRKAGTPNKNTSQLKTAILDAAAMVGSDGNGTDGLTGYCIKLAIREPKAFAQLLGKVMPIQVANAEDEEFNIVTRIERVIVGAKS